MKFAKELEQDLVPGMTTFRTRSIHRTAELDSLTGV